MAVAYVQEFAIVDRSTQNYDFVADKIGDGPLGVLAQPMIEKGPDAFPNPDAFTMPTREGFYELHHIVGG